ncbi:WhiB family transcriptional regulator [Nocardiopsis kunsanensis]|uniref:Transcriptional regulator WhiB n=1 Tax=Nocardiopsis kunsanensis TaxID=141693 RepID=A0A918XJ49_9ACTN|nr:WhiB family transcriptional regulator [Nocardiopsis kunsanensis]GHD34472.1 hypothetical protein GCM10007147_40130 [Nocardiopsis kunsanensis]
MPDPLTDSRARCRDRGLDPDAMFVTGAAQNLVKRVCYPCPLRTACLAYALDNRIECGVWGGMTERERRALRRRRPEVSDWAGLLQQAEQHNLNQPTRAA